MQDTLVQLQDRYQFRTDKNTRHFYLDTYDQLFASYKHLSGNLLEIGVEWGGSISLWEKYFSKMNIVGMDIAKYLEHMPEADRITYHFGNTAYTQAQIDMLKATYGMFNIIIDDGPHNLESHYYTITQYSKLITKGLLIIEDVNRTDIANELKWIYELPRNFSVTVIDKNSSRRVSEHLDDCLIIIEFI